MASGGPAAWTNIESDPGVFTALVEAFGASGAEFAELYALDDEEFARLGHVYGLIFLFKWQAGENDDRPTVPEDPGVPGLFYAKQMVPNACASQAILGVLLNAAPPESPQPEEPASPTPPPGGAGLQLGGTLRELRAFAAPLPYDMRGLAIENSAPIRAAHNSFARPEPFLQGPEAIATKDDDVFHFVAYVPFGGRVYELDGLKGGPIDLGPVPTAAAPTETPGEEENAPTTPEPPRSTPSTAWLGVARQAVASRVDLYAASEIKFNLMAIVRDARQVIDDERAALMAAKGGAGAEDDDAALVAALADLDARKEREVAKREAWATENARRRHNYVPLAVDILKVLAEKGALRSLIDRATTANNAVAAGGSA